MVKIQAKTVVCLLTANIPMNHVNPSKGSSTNVAFSIDLHVCGSIGYDILENCCSIYLANAALGFLVAFIFRLIALI